MSDLDIKLKEFLAKGKRIKELRSVLKGLNYCYPYEFDKEKQKKIDEGIKKTEAELKTLIDTLDTFTKEEYRLLYNKFEIIHDIKICPFCNGNIIKYSNEIFCGKCKHLFYED